MYDLNKLNNFSFLHEQYTLFNLNAMHYSDYNSPLTPFGLPFYTEKDLHKNVSAEYYIVFLSPLC